MNGFRCDFFRIFGSLHHALPRCRIHFFIIFIACQRICPFFNEIDADILIKAVDVQPFDIYAEVKGLALRIEQQCRRRCIIKGQLQGFAFHALKGILLNSRKAGIKYHAFQIFRI